jgi:predicted AlkP superfamily pyrophosphatase or phosphodiesterase
MRAMRDSERFFCDMRVKALLVVALWLCGSLVFADGEKNRTVVVISLDGFPAYALKDPHLPVPTLRRLMEQGAYAESMLPINPTVTWPNHTAMVTGMNAAEHHVLFNGLLVESGPNHLPKIEPWRPKEEMVHGRTVYDLAHDAGMTTAQVDWVAIYNAKTIDWQFAEKPDPSGTIERELVAAGTLTEEQLRSFEDADSAWQDEIWTDAAVEILEKHAPNLLLVHLLNLDNTNHEYGPMSGASFTAMAFLDDRVKQILNAINKSGRAAQTSVIIVSDHGFRPIRSVIRPNVLLHEKGLTNGPDSAPPSAAWVIPDGGVAMVYVTDPAKRETVLPQLRTLLQGLEGVEKVYGGDEFGTLGLPRKNESNQAPDLLLSAKESYSFGNGMTGDLISRVENKGAHGYLNSDPSMQAIFIAWGAGIKKDTRLGKIDNVDVAPTIAWLLGLEMKTPQAHALQEILITPPVK